MGNIDEKIKSLIDNTEIIEDSFEKYGISIISYSVRVDSDDENNPDYDLVTHMELSGKSDEERVVNYVFYDKNDNVFESSRAWGKIDGYRLIRESFDYHRKFLLKICKCRIFMT